jgi:16S rRNA (cytosine1402-N4)-methyltransferase
MMMNDKQESGVSKEHYHTTVLLHETVDALNMQPNGVYVDCTMGGGGHTRLMLSKLGPSGKLFAFDQDADAVRNIPQDDRLVFVPQNFRHLQRFLRLHDVVKVDGVLADLGVSSHQFDEGGRGFSYRFDAELDMRMDQRLDRTAATVANTFSAEQLQEMLSQYGEVTNAKTLAQNIVSSRAQRPFKSINDLLNVLKPLAKGNPNRYFAQVFQAFRMEVNEEVTTLKEMLEQLPKVLKPGGRAAIISFHSLEDRIVKTFFKQGTFELKDDPLYGSKAQKVFEVITKKPIEPSAKEIKENPRAGSARLRVAELINNE